MANDKQEVYEANRQLDEAEVGKSDTLGKRILLLVNWRNALNYSLDAADKDRQSLRDELARVRGLLQRVLKSRRAGLINKCRNCGWQILLRENGWVHSDELMPSGTCDKPEPETAEFIFNALAESVLELDDAQMIQELTDVGLDPAAEVERVRQIIQRARPGQGAESVEMGKVNRVDEKNVQADVYSLALKLIEESTGAKADQFTAESSLSSPPIKEK